MRAPRLARAWIRWLAPAARREEIDADLVEELELRAAESSPTTARRWYRRQALAFGWEALRRAPRTTADLAARLRPAAWITATDMRVAVRLAARQPVASLTAILALATATTLALTGFTLARGIGWSELPIEGGDRIYQALVSEPPAGRRGPSASEALAWMEGAASLTAIGVFQPIVPSVQIGEQPPRPIEGARITPEPFSRLAPPPLLGRHLTASDARAGAEPVVVVREVVWRHPRGFAGAPDVIGRQLKVGGVSHTVVGVLPDSWGFPVSNSLWLPIRLDELAARSAAEPEAAVGRWLSAWVMLPEKGAAEPIEARLESLARSAGPPREDRRLEVQLMPYVEAVSEGMGTTVATLIVVVFLALITTVALNVSTLVLARCAQRSGELAVRSALGAPRLRLLAQMFVESLVLGTAAAVIGLVAANEILRWARPILSADMPFWFDLTIGGWEMGYAAAAAVLSALVAGVVPALRVTARGRIAGPMHGHGSRTVSVALGRVTGTLLALQLALSMAVLAVAGLLLQGFLDYADDGRIPESGQILTALLRRDAALTGTEAGWDLPALHRYREAVEEGLTSIPGARAVAVGSTLPRFHGRSDRIEVDGVDESSLAQVASVGPGFLEALGRAPVQGRSLRRSDAEPDSVRVAVVSESFAHELLAGRSPLGRRIRVADPGDAAASWIEIVGLVPDVGLSSARTAAPEVYLPLIGSRYLYVLVRTDGDAIHLASDLRRAVAEIDPTVFVTDIQTLADVGWEYRAFLRGGSGVMAVVGVAVLLLSLAGVYALASLSVTSRTREIGIRVALGASAGGILATVLRSTIIQLGIGLVGGTTLAFGLSRLTLLLPFEIPRSLALSLPLVAAVMVGAGLLASILPARRALRIEPMEALRSE